MPAETKRERQTKTAEAAQIELGREELRQRGASSAGRIINFQAMNTFAHICIKLNG